MSSVPAPPPPRIFLISFNKCGTGSFTRLFRKSRIAAVHHHVPGGETAKQARAASIAVIMFKNFMLARDPLTGLQEFTAFTDLAYYTDEMIYEAGRLYPYLHQHYPDAYFILATREVEDWIRSRLSHGGGSLAARAEAALGEASQEDVAATWRAQFAAHNAEVRSWFAARPDARFLEFDLDADAPERIAEFLAPDFRIKTAGWGRANVTREETRARAAQRRDGVEP